MSAWTPAVLAAGAIFSVWYVDWMPKCWCGERSIIRGLCRGHHLEQVRKEHGVEPRG